MALKKYSKSHHSTMNELNITPLLDLAFVLLVIFIIATAPMVNDIDLNLPSKQTPPQQKAAAKRPNFIIVESDGRIFLNGKELQPDALTAELKLQRRRDKDTSVVVHGDSAVMYQVMVSVFDILQRADIQKVGLATDRPSAAMMSKPLSN